MPETLHESQGLKIVKNDKNHFVVCTLLYTADPDKRSPEWEAEARAGITKAQFEKEYLISYFALFGEKVFPQLTEHKGKIVVNEPYPEISDHSFVWGGFDYGIRNPSSFHIYCVEDGVIYSIWELFEPCTNLPAFAAKMKACPYWPRLRYVAADRSLWSNNQARDQEFVSVQQLLLENGVDKLMRGSIDESAFLSKINEHWRDLDNREPTFRIFSCCPNQIREFESAVYVNLSETQLQNQNTRETLVQKNNHSIDDCKYAMLSYFPPTTKKIKMPDLSKLW